MLLPEKKQSPSQKGRRPYDYRIIAVLCILRILLRKTYEDYEIEIRTHPDIKRWLELSTMPSKSTLQRGMEIFSMRFWRQWNKAMIKPWLRARVSAILDASGIRIIGSSIWYSIRIKREIKRHDCDKVHLAVCNDTLLILNWFITKWSCNESRFFGRLLKPFRELGLVFGDKEFCARKHFQYVADKGGAAFIDLKKNITGKRKMCPAWKSTILLWKSSLSFIYKAICKQRSKIEAVFSALKRRYGDHLNSRKRHLRHREMALRFIAYNLKLILYFRYARQYNLPLWVRA